MVESETEDRKNASAAAQRVQVHECSAERERERKMCNNCETTLRCYKYNLFLMTTVYVPVNIADVFVDATNGLVKMFNSNDMASTEWKKQKTYTLNITIFTSG